jgi:hypothetical protein
MTTITNYQIEELQQERRPIRWLAVSYPNDSLNDTKNEIACLREGNPEVQFRLVKIQTIKTVID